jgi:hypothetical protein
LIFRPIIPIIIFTSIFAACKYDEEIISDNPGLSIVFSSDTISFDTVFTDLGSVTKRLTVLNPNKNAIILDRVYVGKGSESAYQITVSGVEQNEVRDQIVYGNDSLLILVNVTINPDDRSLPFIVADSILFAYNNQIRHVILRSWGQNANYIGDSIIRQDQVWESDIPYFLSGSILIDSLKSLHITEGTRIYVSNGASVFVRGTLVSEGTADRRISFRNARMDKEYENVPGQWGGILFLEGSINNIISYTDIRNAQYGLRVGTPDPDTIPDVVVKNSRIENTIAGGIVAFTSDLLVENSLINTSTGYVLANLAGGNYEYIHCTFANYGSLFFRQAPSVVLSNILLLDDNTLIEEKLAVNFKYSIVWGDMKEEIVVEEGDNTGVSISTDNSIFKTSLFIFEGNNSYLSTETDFMQFLDIQNYNYTPDSLSPAIDKAWMSGMKFDLLGEARDSFPDAGAIEFLKQ